MIASCHQIETTDPIFNAEKINVVKSIDEEKLLDLSVFFASILTNPDVLEEFYGYSKLDGNEGELEFSLKKVFETDFNPIARKKSAITSRFKMNGERLKAQPRGFDVDEFIDFMIKNDLEVLAPYLARNFSIESLDELTISWWTEEMQNQGLKNDPNWKGETPAFKINLKENASFESIKQGLIDKTIEVFMVSDEYAMKNPTIVFGAFDEGLYDRHEKAKMERNNKANLFLYNVVPANVGINCDQVQSNDVVRWMIPDFRILDNTKGWPSPSYISLWVAVGAYSSGSGGVPVLGFNVNRLLNKKKINRGDFEWKRDFLEQPLITHWHESNISVQLIIAYD